MSQRRNANSKAPVVAEAVITGPLSLEATPNSIAEETVSLTAVPEEGPSLRVKKWKESPFAVGLTEPTWEAQRLAGKYKEDEEGDDDYLPNPDSSGCLCCSALICPLVGAGRVGNMAVLHSSVEWVEEVEEDEETGETKTRRYSRPKLNWVVGPLYVSQRIGFSFLMGTRCQRFFSFWFMPCANSLRILLAVGPF
jgi:hypothetical protein